MATCFCAGLSIRNGATDSKGKSTDQAGGSRGPPRPPCWFRAKPWSGVAENGFQHFGIAMVASPEIV